MIHDAENPNRAAGLSPALQQAIVREMLCRDFRCFNARAFEELEGRVLDKSWHIEAICHALEQVASGEVTRLLVTMPPRSLKSQMISTSFPAWLMGRDPSRKIITTSYGEDLAIAFANNWRRLLETRWYRSAFPDTKISARKNREGETHLTRGGVRLSLSAGGPLTGRGADLIIVDDPLKASDAYSDPARKRINNWFGQTLVSRLNDKRTGAIIVVMQRLHPDDLAGHLIESGGWHHLNLPAIAPRDCEIPLGHNRSHKWQVGSPLQPLREPEPVLDQLKRDIGTRDFNAQYLQCPVPEEGNTIKLKYFQRGLPNEPEQGPETTVISVDTANVGTAGADYSVLQVWRILGNSYALVDQRRGHWDYPELKRETIALSDRNARPRLLIEEAGTGYALNKELRAAGHNSFAVKPKGSKEQRLALALPTIESERVFLPQNAAWLGDFEAEVSAFPAGSNDDQVDAMTQFLNWAAKPRPDFSKLIGLRVSHI